MNTCIEGGVTVDFSGWFVCVVVPVLVAGISVIYWLSGRGVFKSDE